MCSEESHILGLFVTWGISLVDLDQSFVYHTSTLTPDIKSDIMGFFGLPYDTLFIQQ